MKLKIYLLAGILLSGFSQLYAQSGQFGDHVYWSLEDSVLTVSGEGDMYNNALTYLREIYFISGDHWYDCRYGIKSVIIEEGVTSTGNAAFYDCTSLTSIVIPSTCNYIGQLSFMGCNSLVEVINRRQRSVYIDHESAFLIGNKFTGYELIYVDFHSFYGLDLSKITLYVPSESFDLYRSDAGWTEFVNMIALKSSDAALQSITVSAGTLSPAFNPDTLSYIATVPDSVTEVTVTATARHSGANIDGGGSKQLSPGWNSFDIHVTAEDGITVKIYAVQVYRSTANGGGNPVDFQLYSDESAVSADRIPLQSITTTAGVLVPAFHPDTPDYAVLVPYHTTEITATGTAADGRVLSYTKALPYPGSITHFPFGVIGCRTYDIAVTRPSDQTDLQSLRLSAGDPIKYHPDTLEYKVSVPYSIDTVTIFAKEGVFANTFSGAGFKRLNVGENTFEIVVTAESGIHTETYTVKVYRQSPDVTDATLKNLTLNSGAIPLKFQPSILKYRVEVEGEVSEIEIDCEANPGTTVSNAGVHTLDYGENVFTVTVKAEDFETQYTITVYRLRNDATLKYLVIAPVELTPPFDPDITQYTAKFPFSNTANVPYSVSSISMDFDVNDSLAELWTNPELERPGTKQLNVGENVFGIGVSAEDKRCYRAYWIRITREAPPVTTGLDEAGAPAAVQVYTANGRLYVNSPATEHINIYSVTGKLLYSFYKPAGAFTSPFTVHPSPVLIVKSSSGWSEKLVVSGY